jgi:hypothetical protein
MVISHMIPSSLISIPTSQGRLPYRYCHFPYRYCHLKVIFHVDTVILSSCGQDDQIVSCHSGRNTPPPLGSTVHTLCGIR